MRVNTRDIYINSTRSTGESYRRRLRSLLLCLCDVFQVLTSPCVYNLTSHLQQFQLEPQSQPFHLASSVCTVQCTAHFLESYHRQLRSLLLHLCEVFRVLINSAVFIISHLICNSFNSNLNRSRFTYHPVCTAQYTAHFLLRLCCCVCARSFEC